MLLGTLLIYNEHLMKRVFDYILVWHIALNKKSHFLKSLVLFWIRGWVGSLKLKLWYITHTPGESYLCVKLQYAEIHEVSHTHNDMCINWYLFLSTHKCARCSQGYVERWPYPKKLYRWNLDAHKKVNRINKDGGRGRFRTRITMWWWHGYVVCYTVYCT